MSQKLSESIDSNKNAGSPPTEGDPRKVRSNISTNSGLPPLATRQPSAVNAAATAPFGTTPLNQSTMLENPSSYYVQGDSPAKANSSIYNSSGVLSGGRGGHSGIIRHSGSSTLPSKTSSNVISSVQNDGANSIGGADHDALDGSSPRRATKRHEGSGGNNLRKQKKLSRHTHYDDDDDDDDEALYSDHDYDDYLDEEENLLDFGDEEGDGGFDDLFFVKSKKDGKKHSGSFRHIGKDEEGEIPAQSHRDGSGVFHSLDDESVSLGMGAPNPSLAMYRSGTGNSSINAQLAQLAHSPSKASYANVLTNNSASLNNTNSLANSLGGSFRQGGANQQSSVFGYPQDPPVDTTANSTTGTNNNNNSVFISTTTVGHGDEGNVMPSVVGTNEGLGDDAKASTQQFHADTQLMGSDTAPVSQEGGLASGLMLPQASFANERELRKEARRLQREQQLNAMRQYRLQQRRQKQATVFNESSIADPNPHLWLFEHRTDERPKRKVFRGAMDLSDYINGLFEFQEVQREARKDEKDYQKEVEREERLEKRRLKAESRKSKSSRTGTLGGLPSPALTPQNATKPDPLSSESNLKNATAASPDDTLTKKSLAQHQQQHVAFNTPNNVPSVIANHHDPVLKAAIAAIPTLPSPAIEGDTAHHDLFSPQAALAQPASALQVPALGFSQKTDPHVDAFLKGSQATQQGGSHQGSAPYISRAQRAMSAGGKPRKRRNIIPMSDGGIISSSSSSSSGSSSSSSSRSSSSKSHRRARSRVGRSRHGRTNSKYGKSSTRTSHSSTSSSSSSSSRSSSSSSTTSSSSSSSSSSDDSVEQCFWLDIQDTEIERIVEIVKTFDHAGDAIIPKLRRKWAEDAEHGGPNDEDVPVVRKKKDYDKGSEKSDDDDISSSGGGRVAAANAQFNIARKKKNTKFTTDFLEAERASRFVYVKIQHQKLERDDEAFREEEARRAERLEAKRRRNMEVKLRKQQVLSQGNLRGLVSDASPVYQPSIDPSCGRITPAVMSPTTGAPTPMAMVNPNGHNARLTSHAIQRNSRHSNEPFTSIAGHMSADSIMSTNPGSATNQISKNFPTVVANDDLLQKTGNVDEQNLPQKDYYDVASTQSGQNIRSPATTTDGNFVSPSPGIGDALYPQTTNNTNTDHEQPNDHGTGAEPKVMSLNEIRILMGLRPYYHIHVLCFKQWIITIHSDPVDGMLELVRRIHGAFGFKKTQRKKKAGEDENNGSPLSGNRQGGGRRPANTVSSNGAQTLSMVGTDIMTTGWVMASLIEFVIQSYLPDPKAIYADIGATEELVTELSTNDTNLYDEHKAMLKRIGYQLRYLSDSRQLLLDKERLLRQLLSPLIRLTFISKYRMIADQYDYMLEQVYHHVQHIDTAKEMLSQINGNFANALTIYMTSVADRKNDRLAVLSRVASICLPLNLITGLMGMNCTVPFQTDDSEETPWAFIGIIILMVVFFLSTAQTAKLWRWSNLWAIITCQERETEGGDFTEGRTKQRRRMRFHYK